MRALKQKGTQRTARRTTRERYAGSVVARVFAKTAARVDSVDRWTTKETPRVEAAPI